MRVLTKPHLEYRRGSERRQRSAGIGGGRVRNFLPPPDGVARCHRVKRAGAIGRQRSAPLATQTLPARVLLSGRFGARMAPDAGDARCDGRRDAQNFLPLQVAPAARFLPPTECPGCRWRVDYRRERTARSNTIPSPLLIARPGAPVTSASRSARPMLIIKRLRGAEHHASFVRVSACRCDPVGSVCGGRGLIVRCGDVIGSSK